MLKVCAISKTQREISIVFEDLKDLPGQTLVIPPPNDYAPLTSEGFANAGGFSFESSESADNALSQGRFILWKVHDGPDESLIGTGRVLDLVDVYLEQPLSNNFYRIMLPYSVADDGVRFLESTDSEPSLNLFVLTTENSLHKFTFAHPASFEKPASIFGLKRQVVNYWNLQAHGPMSVLSESMVAIGTNVGTINVVQLSPDSSFREIELQDSVLPGFVKGFLPKRLTSAAPIRGLAAYENFIWSLDAEAKIKVWNNRTGTVVLTHQSSWDPNLEPVGIPAEVHLRFVRTVGGFRFVVAVETDTDSRFFLYSGEVVNGEPEFELDRINYNSKANQLSALQIAKGQVWTLWRDIDEAGLSAIPWPASNKLSALETSVWSPVVVETRAGKSWSPTLAESRTNKLDGLVPAADIQESYATHIFESNKFTTAMIDDAFALLSGEPLLRATESQRVDISRLKARVLDFIGHRISRERLVADPTSAENETDNLVEILWSQFLDACVDQWHRHSQPYGIFCHPTLDVVVVIRHRLVSFVRACSTTEQVQLLLSSPLATREEFQHYKAHLEINTAHPQDVQTLVTVGRLLAEALGPHLTLLEQDLLHLVPLPALADLDSVHLLMSDNAHLANLRHISDLFSSILDPTAAVQWLLRLLSEPVRGTGRGSAWKGIGHLLVGEACFQLADAGWILARNLLISLSLNTRLNLQHSNPFLVAQTMACMNNYFILRHFSQLSPHPTLPGIESILDGLTQLGLERDLPPTHSNRGLFSLFYQYEQNKGMRKRAPKATRKPSRVTGGSGGSAFGSQITHLAASILGEVWLPDHVGRFAKFLLHTRQYLHLQTLIRLMRLLLSDATPYPKSAVVHASGLQHYLARAFLQLGDYQKAEVAFNQAARGILQDDPLVLRFCEKEMRKHEVEPGPDHRTSFLIQYYTSAMEFFEVVSQHDISIRFASSAIALLQKGSRNEDRLAKLWHKIVIHAVSMSHWEQAYGAIISNPNVDHRKDGLRKLVVRMCERKAVASLCQLPLVGLVSEVDSTLKEQAQNAKTSMQPHYYEILYAFHTYRGNFSEAATNMYRFSVKLALESGSSEATLNRRIHALLAAINALRLVAPRYQFIFHADTSVLFCSGCGKAVEQGERYALREGKAYHDRCSNFCLSCGQFLERGHICPELPAATGKRNSTGELRLAFQTQPSSTHLTLDDIEMHYLVLKAQKLLGSHLGDNPVTGRPSLEDVQSLFAMLIGEGFYDLALAVAKKLSKADLTPLFVSLAQRALEQQVDPSLYRTPSESWTHTLLARHSSGNAWYLLKDYLEHFDSERTNFRYHSVVADCIFATDRRICLPAFLEESFLRHSVGALLSILLKHNLMADACRLLIRLLREAPTELCALCGSPLPADAPQCRQDGCEGAPSSRRRQLLLPYSQMERLQTYLDSQRSEPAERHLLAELRQAQAQYFPKVLPEGR